MDNVSDLSFFVQLVRQGSLSALARELGVTPPAISARLARMESRLGVRLLNRTTRRLSPTQEGTLYLDSGTRLLAEIEELDRVVAARRSTPHGLLRVNATFGFGRRHIAPAIDAFVLRFADVEVQLTLTDRAVNLRDQAYDVGIAFGELPDSRLVARRLAANQRFLCASPAYLRRAGEPSEPGELQRHQCIVLRESESAYGSWHLSRGPRTETVKVRGQLSTNDGETAVGWALAGHGILMRSEWDVRAHLRSGDLVRVLPEWSLPSADVFAVYGERHGLSAKVTAFIDFLIEWMAIETPG